MKLYKVTDPEFISYGRVLKDPAFDALIEKLSTEPMPQGEVIYVPGAPELEELEAAGVMSTKVFGEMPVQCGYCNGDNTKLNALEYHRSSEINYAATDAILLLGSQQDVTPEMTYDTEKVMAFLVPAGTTIEVYATTLHYAPCNAPGQSGFRVGVALPKGTNLELKEKHEGGSEDAHLTATNKWLLGHPEGGLPAGSPMGLIGKNWDVSVDLD